MSLSRLKLCGTVVFSLWITCLKPFSLLAVDQKPYIVGELRGQAGNNFFQIAATCALAWDHGAEAYFPGLAIIPSLYHHFFSRCKVHPPQNEISCREGQGPPLESYAPIPYTPKMLVTGYLQSEKYFAHHRDRILKLFAPCAQDLQYIRKKYGKILDHPQTVGVQIRYYFDDADGNIFCQYGKDYLEKAMSLFPKSSLFIISSNNIEFAKKNTPAWAKVFYLQNEPPYIDFYILTLCKDNIITNSSFGWWIAWLNQNPNKKIVRPSVWLKGLMCQREVCPESWVKVEAKAGKVNDPTSY